MTTKKTIDELTILVVEDNIFTSMFIGKTLKSLGISQVETMTDGKSALKLLITLKPDVILLDLRMPIMGGSEFLSRLSDMQYQGHIILMSGVDTEILISVEQKAQQNHLSILGSIKKPPNAEGLSTLLSKICK